MTEPRLLTRSLSALRERIDPAVAPIRTMWRRVRLRSGGVIIAALVFVVIALVTELTWQPALAGFLLLAAVIAGNEPGADGEEEGLAIAPIRGSAQPPPDRDSSGWRALLDAIPDGVVALDQNLYVMHFNTVFQELFPKVRIGQPLSHLSRNPELNEAVEKVSVANDAIIVNIFERVPVERRFQATVSKLQANQGRRGLPLLIISVRDLTEQDKLDQMRADFIANASHELRTPLASLRGFVETLQGPARDDPEARDRFLTIMSSQANRMTRLIDDLLSLSRVEMRVHLPPKGIVDLNEVAAYVAQALEPLAAGSKMKIIVGRTDTPLRIRGDRDEIVQVMQNLVHNAIKYGREGGRVEIGVARVLDGSPPIPRALLAVADDGPGIAPEHLPRLTERFYRANITASREKGGTGLGLAIVKHIIIRHRGELRITSVVGKGSTFSVLFDEIGART